MKNLSKDMAQSKGFTLVELSIVIIIIGFLIAGVTTGADLVNHAQMNSVISDMQGFHIAYNNFVARYNELPGDMTDGAAYWPTGASGCASDADAYCRGNGDGFIELNYTYISPGCCIDETIAAWRELSLAGMVAGGGIAPVNAGTQNAQVILGITHPASKIDGAGYVMFGTPNVSGYVNYALLSQDINYQDTFSPWVGASTNAVFIGKTGDCKVGLCAGALLAEDAFNIDQKIDDGSVDASGNFTGAITGNFRTVTCVGCVWPNPFTNTSNNYPVTAGGYYQSGLALD